MSRATGLVYECNGSRIGMAGYSITIIALLAGIAKLIIINSGIWLGKK
jgi:hypothetical protein